MKRAAESEEHETPEFESRFPRRLLFAGAAAGIAGTAVVTTAAPAEAAPASTPWQLGGNSGVTTSNFLGPTTAGIPLIIKTKNTSTSSVTEKMRVSPGGQVGIGLTAPVAKLDVLSSGSIAVQGRTTGTSTAARGVNGSAPEGYGVQGVSEHNIGVYGDGGSAGVWGKGVSYGIVGDSPSYGASLSGGYAGVYSSGTTYGVLGYGSTVGVYGSGGVGVSGVTSDVNSTAVSGSGGQYAVRGMNARTAGVRGDSGYVGVWAEAPTYGIYANSTATSGQVYGVYGQATSPAGFGIFSQGNAHVTGTLSKAAGSFRIDHPLDPDNRWLSHSFVESPDMMNIYNGNVTTDGNGDAAVTLPEYFSALNRDVRYQLTVIGSFAQAIVAKKVDGNSFSIKTDKPSIEVSWQVTGIRQDPYAEAHPIVVETPKTGTDAGARQFVPKGSSARLAPTAPGRPTDQTAPQSPKVAPAPKNTATP